PYSHYRTYLAQRRIRPRASAYVKFKSSSHKTRGLLFSLDVLDLESACAFRTSWPNQSIAERPMLLLLAHFSVPAKSSDKSVESYAQTDADILVRESPKTTSTPVGKNQKSQELCPTGRDLEHGFSATDRNRAIRDQVESPLRSRSRSRKCSPRFAA